MDEETTKKIEERLKTIEQKLDGISSSRQADRLIRLMDIAFAIGHVKSNDEELRTTMRKLVSLAIEFNSMLENQTKQKM